MIANHSPSYSSYLGMPQGAVPISPQQYPTKINGSIKEIGGSLEYSMNIEIFLGNVLIFKENLLVKDYGSVLNVSINSWDYQKGLGIIQDKILFFDKEYVRSYLPGKKEPIYYLLTGASAASDYQTFIQRRSIILSILTNPHNNTEKYYELLRSIIGNLQIEKVTATKEKFSNNTFSFTLHGIGREPNNDIVEIKITTFGKIKEYRGS